jgi:hypothetical protein
MNPRDLPFLSAPGGSWWALAVAAAATELSYWLLRRLRAF